MISITSVGRHSSGARRSSVPPAAALAYLGLVAGWVYLVADTPRGSHSPWNGGAVFFAALGLHFLVGFAIGRPWALALPLLAGLLAIPAGYAYGEYAGEYDLFPVFPLWADILLAQIILLPTLAAGVFLGAWVRLRVSAIRASSGTVGREGWAGWP